MFVIFVCFVYIYTLLRSAQLGLPVLRLNTAATRDATRGAGGGVVRAQNTFAASRTNLRLVAFRIAFLHTVGRPAGAPGPEDVRAGYSMSGGWVGRRLRSAPSHAGHRQAYARAARLVRVL